MREKLEMSYAVQNIGVFFIVVGYFGFSPNPFFLGIVLGFGALVFRWMKWKQKPDVWQLRKSWKFFMLLLIIYVLSAIIPAFFSLNKVISLEAAISRFNWWRPCFFVMLLYNTKKGFWLSIWLSFVVGTLKICGSTFAELVSGQEFAFRRLAGEVGNPNILAAHLNLFVPWLVLGTFFFRKNFFLLFVGAVTSLTAIIVIMCTISRGAVIAAGTTMIMICCVFGIRGAFKKKYGIGLLAMCVLIGVFAPSQIQKRFEYKKNSTLLSEVQRKEIGRIRVWQSAINMFGDHPLTGVGLNNFGEPYRNSYLTQGSTESHLEHAHNLFLQQLAETGIIGCVGFCFVLFVQLGYLYKKMLISKNRPWLICGFAVFLVAFFHSMVDFFFANSFYCRILALQWGVCYCLGENVSVSQELYVTGATEKR